MVVVVLVFWTGKCVIKNGAEDEDGALDWKLCAEKQDRGWWCAETGDRVKTERTEMMWRRCERGNV